MYHIKDDLREQKTAELLVEAARQQLLDRNKEPGTIAGLCRASGVSRSTFYRHFDSYDDVLRYIADVRMMEMTGAYLEHLRSSTNPVNPAMWYATWILDHYRELVALLRKGKSQLLIDAHVRALYDHAPALFPDMDPDSDEFMFFAYTRSYTAIGALQAWLKTGRKASAEELAGYMEKQLRFLNGT